MTRRNRAEQRTVLVWRNDVLHGSETFIRNQVNATREWHAVLTGARRWESVLSEPDDEILFGRSFIERLRRQVFLRVGVSRRADRLIRARGVTLVHAHFATSAATILPVARRHRLPLVVTVHGFDVTNHRLRTGRAGKRYVRRTRRVFQYASRIIAVSDFIATATIDAFGVDPQRVRVLPIGVPVAAEAPVRHETRDLVFVGRLVEKKGALDLLAALSLLAARGERFTTTIVGDGPLRGRLQAEAASRGLAVDFVGAVPPAAVATTMASSHVLVAPSRVASDGDAEGFGMVFLEAALAGTPAIAYRHGGVPEAVVDGVTGLLVDEGDIDALADAIAALLADPKRRATMGRAAQVRVRADFDIAACTDRLVALYEEVAAEGEPEGSRER